MGLEDEVNLMKKLYFKGFGSLICAIFGKGEIYLRGKDGVWKDSALEILTKIEEHYQQIPFDILDSNSDFAPLFVVRDLLKDYGGLMREFFENPTEEKLERISSLRTSIGHVEGIYRKNFEQKLKELRSLPEYENHYLEIIDHEGKKFFM